MIFKLINEDVESINNDEKQDNNEKKTPIEVLEVMLNKLIARYDYLSSTAERMETDLY